MIICADKKMSTLNRLFSIFTVKMDNLCQQNGDWKGGNLPQQYVFSLLYYFMV